MLPFTTEVGLLAVIPVRVGALLTPVLVST